MPNHTQFHTLAPAEEGQTVRYMDGSALLKDFKIPIYVKIFALIVAVVALFMGGKVFLQASDYILHHSEHVAEEIQGNLTREVSLELPDVAAFTAMDDETFKASLDEAGIPYIDYSTEQEGLKIVKLPSDADAAEAKEIMDSGINTMDAVTASFYLPGYYQLTRSVTEGTDIRLRFVDLNSQDQESAVGSTKDALGWTDNENVTVDEEGVDSVGNNYQTGTLYTDAGTFTWTISSCPMSSIYDISGMPENASYVGLHITD
ncbi:hypothetical protein [Slackia heliotrinireducens]|uniref:hypothetical protein n=1 Tax=Slackia heliotrinireducens TaxID=84110 RepID=UPI003315BF19